MLRATNLCSKHGQCEVLIGCLEVFNRVFSGVNRLFIGVNSLLIGFNGLFIGVKWLFTFVRNMGSDWTIFTAEQRRPHCFRQ